MVSRYITPEGFARMQGEFEQLWNIERPALLKTIADAAAEGDRSENAEYIYGRKKLRELDRRASFLSKRLEQVEVVDAADRGGERVYFGAWVRVFDENLESERDFRIVGSDEHDMDPRYVSMDSPVARALIGKRIGDEVVIRRPRGDLEVTILRVMYQAP